MTRSSHPAVEEIAASVHTVPTDAPEADGTLSWNETTLLLVEARGGGGSGIGYAYTDASAGVIVRNVLAPTVEGVDAFDVPRARALMRRRVRNIGWPGVASSAVAAVETALWDLKARLLDLPLASLLGRRREAVDAYGSGGFTTYDDERLGRQLAAWVDAGMRRVKMKIGPDPARDVERVAEARRAIGTEVELFVDANGAYEPRDALEVAWAMDGEAGISWFEEPVTSDDLPGLRFVRERTPASTRVAAGEYGYDTSYFRAMLEAEAVDVLQIDATRCGGCIGFLEAAALCEAWARPASAHTAPLLHTHLGCAAPRLVHVEYFHDHVRIERMAFEGVPEPRDGRLAPDLGCPGLGVEVKHADLEPYRTA